MVKKQKKGTSKMKKSWFKEHAESILIVPTSMRGRIALAVFLGLIFLVSYVNFGYEQTPLRSSLNFILDLILICGLVGWFFDRKSDKKTAK